MNENGILLHSFWYGDKEEIFSGLRFVYYTEETLKDCIDEAYEVLEVKRYAEMEADDSLYLVLGKNK